MKDGHPQEHLLLPLQVHRTPRLVQLPTMHPLELRLDLQAVQMVVPQVEQTEAGQVASPALEAPQAVQMVVPQVEQKAVQLALPGVVQMVVL